MVTEQSRFDWARHWRRVLVRGLAIGIGGLMWVATPAIAASTLTMPIQEGAALFSMNCVACHIHGQNLIIPEKNLHYETLRTYGMYSADAIMWQVRHGKNIMPAFGDQFSPEQLEAIAAYVMDQAQQDWKTTSD